MNKLVIVCILLLIMNRSVCLNYFVQANVFEAPVNSQNHLSIFKGKELQHKLEKTGDLSLHTNIIFKFMNHGIYNHNILSFNFGKSMYSVEIENSYNPSSGKSDFEIKLYETDDQSNIVATVKFKGSMRTDDYTAKNIFTTFFGIVLKQTNEDNLLIELEFHNLKFKGENFSLKQFNN